MTSLGNRIAARGGPCFIDSTFGGASTLGGVITGDGIWQFIRSMSWSQWLLILHPFMMAMVQRRRLPGDVFVVDGSAMVQIAYTLICAVYVLKRLLQSPRDLAAMATTSPLRWVFLYGILAITSVFWSDSPRLTIYRSLQYVVYFALVLDAAARLRTIEGMTKHLMLYSLVVMVLLQVHGGLNAASEELTMNNIRSPQTAQVTGLVFFLGLGLRSRGWRVLSSLFLFSVVTGFSSTTNVSIVMGLVVLAMTAREKRARVASLILVLSIGVLALYSISGLTHVLFPGKNERQILTLTGRLDAWEWFFREAFPKRPWLGYGFGVGESIARIANVTGLRMTHMHNPLVSALANLGLVGGVFYILTVLSAITRAVAVPIPHWRGPICAATAVAVLNSQAGVSVTSTVNFPWISNCLLLALLALSTQQQVAEKAIFVLRPTSCAGSVRISQGSEASLAPG